MGAVCRRGLTRGLQSQPFAPAALLRAAGDLASAPRTVVVDVDGAGFLWACGGAERVAAGARLAPHVTAAHVVLARAATGLVLRVERPAPPLHDLLLWFDDQLAAALRLPFLALRHIRGRKEYECSECGALFEEPNPLKLHMFLRCAEPAPRRLWREVAARLRPAASPAPAVSPTLVSPAMVSPAPLPPTSPAEAWAARLEAAATAWGRARDGHACLYCGKLYSRKYGLKIHLRTHTGYRPLRCRHCARAFGDPSNLNKHVRLHEAAAGRAPHACSRCGKPLARRRDLERHLRTQCAPTPPAPATTPPAQHDPAQHEVRV